MAEVGKIYKCGVCGNMVQVLESGIGTLTCCDEAMKMQAENMPDDEERVEI